MGAHSAIQAAHPWIADDIIKTRYGDFVFRNGYPTGETIRKLYAFRSFSRAVEAYTAHLGAVSAFHMRRALRELAGEAPNPFAIAETLLDSRSLFLTANTETVYGLCFLDLKRDGPVVIEAPPSVYGDATDMWMRAFVSVGPAGPGKGQGGKFLFLPPDYTGAIPQGFFLGRSPTYGVCFGVRGFQDQGKTEHAVALMKRVKIYPLSKASAPPPVTFINMSGAAINTIFPDNYEYFNSLAALVAEEPADAVPPAERFILASIGIEKGKLFAPDRDHKHILGEAARTGAALARVNAFASRDVEAQVYRDRRWQWAFLGGSHTWDAKGYVNSDQRAAWFYCATGNSPAMVDRKVGSGSQYLWTTSDANGAFLSGTDHYRLHLPPKIPARLFWSVVVYDSASRSELQNGTPFPSLSSYTAAPNPDGSVDIWFGPKAPVGRERNWIRTIPDKGWFPYLRFYSPTEAFFDQSWKPGDIEHLGRSYTPLREARILAGP